MILSNEKINLRRSTSNRMGIVTQIRPG